MSDSKGNDDAPAAVSDTQQEKGPTGNGNQTSETEPVTASNTKEEEEEEKDSGSKALLEQNPRSVSVDDKTKKSSSHVGVKIEAAEPIKVMPISATKPEPRSESREDHSAKKAPTTPAAAPADNGVPTSNSKQSYFEDDYLVYEGSESGTEDDQSNFMKDLELFFKERSMEFKPPKFYGEGLNCLKLWRAVTRLGGYDKVTSCKLWRQVGESFKPPK